eukprot:6068544-Alexandrium_andersonii.AAC.1
MERRRLRRAPATGIALASAGAVVCPVSTAGGPACKAASNAGCWWWNAQRTSTQLCGKKTRSGA